MNLEKNIGDSVEPVTPKKRKKHYVNNPDFLAAIVEYKKSLKEAKEKGKPLPKIPNYIGECIIKIATRLATKPNFSGYSYKDEMISDGIENCFACVTNFNEEKTQNPFAYFTQVIYYAFLRRIQKEKKQTYIQYKVLENELLSGNLAENDIRTNDIKINDDYINSFVEDFENKLEKGKTKNE